MDLYFVLVLLASHVAVSFGEKAVVPGRLMVLEGRGPVRQSQDRLSTSTDDGIELVACNGKRTEDHADRDAYLKMVYSLRLDDAETVEEILSEGMDADTRYVNASIHGRPLTEGSTLLHWAAVYGAIECIPVLLAHGADIESVTDTHFTPLHMASQGGHLTAVKLLVSEGAVVDAQCEIGNTPLHESANRGYAAIVEFLVEAGADVNLANDYGFTALEFAAQSGHLAVAEILVGNEADVDHQDEFGFTALHMAATKGFVTIAEMLISIGADLEIRSIDGYAPLHCASSYGHLDVSEVLVQAGASKTAKSKKGQTPLEVRCKDVNLKCTKETEAALVKLLTP